MMTTNSKKQEYCSLCKRLLDNPSDPLSGDCGGDCWECIGGIAAIGQLKPLIAPQLASQSRRFVRCGTKKIIKERKRRIDYEIDRTTFIFTKHVNKVSGHIVNATRKLVEHDAAQRYMFAMDGDRVREDSTLP